MDNNTQVRHKHGELEKLMDICLPGDFIHTICKDRMTESGATEESIYGHLIDSGIAFCSSLDGKMSWADVLKDGVLLNLMKEELIPTVFDTYTSTRMLGNRQFTEGFLENNKHKLDKFTVESTQSLSPEYIARNITSLDITTLMYNYNLTKESRDLVLNIISMQEKF